MAYNFPVTAVIGQEYAVGTSVYIWTGYSWASKDTSGGSGHTVSDVAPAAPAQGDQWLESDTMILWMWYDDGNSAQWVQVNGTSSPGGEAGIPFDAYTKTEADARFEPLDSPYTKAESDARYEPLDSAYTKGESDNRYEPLDSAYTKAESDGRFVNITGDTMSGNLTGTDAIFNVSVTSPILYATTHITVGSAAWANLYLNKQGSGQGSSVLGMSTGKARWGIELGGAQAETGGNAGSNFALSAYNDDGSHQWVPLWARRTDGHVFIGNSIQVSAPGASTNQPGFYNAETGASMIWEVSPGTSRICCSSQTNEAVVTNINIPGVLDSFYYLGAPKGGINTDGVSVSYNTSSDAALKEDLQSFDAGGILDSISVYDFAWKGTSKRSHGVIAQEAIEVYPNAVFHDTDRGDQPDWWGVDYAKFVPLLLQEVKALRLRVAELEGQVAKK